MNLIFVHIPKNAGNSIRPICRKENIKVISHNIRRRNKRLLAAHRSKKKVHAFCISRNPYDRIVSAYHYLNNGGRNKHDLKEGKMYVQKYENFKDFVVNGLDEAAENQLHFLPQVFWVLNKDGKPEVETVLRQENLQEDFDIFCNEIDLEPKKLEITNKSNHDHWEKYYDDETKQIVAEIYHDDFEFFSYEK